MVLHPVPRDAVAASSRLMSDAVMAQQEAPAPRDWVRDREFAGRLAEIAFIGAFLGQTQDAEAIFRGLRVLRPGEPMVELGLAMVYTLAGHAEAGLALLERAQGLDAENSLVALCTGLILRHAGHRTAAERTLSQAIARGDVAADLVPELSSAMRE